MAFYTGKGDHGTTRLFDSPQGKRVSKSSPIFETLGMLDELNTLTGWCRVVAPSELEAGGRNVHDILLDVQDHLFTLQAEVAGAPKSIAQASTNSMNEIIQTIEKSLPEVKSFLVPGGTEFSARLDIARAVSRRAERRPRSTPRIGRARDFRFQPNVCQSALVAFLCAHATRKSLRRSGRKAAELPIVYSQILKNLRIGYTVNA